MTTEEIQIIHEDIFKTIEIALSPHETDIQIQMLKFARTRDGKNYSEIRREIGYTKWKSEVLKRFHGHCCICMSDTKLVAHHLNSYKYYPKLRTELNNGACVCQRCHIAFHDLYENRNTVGQFFEYRKICKTGELLKYLLDSNGIIQIDKLMNNLEANNVKFKIIELRYLKVIFTDKSTFRHCKNFL